MNLEERFILARLRIIEIQAEKEVDEPFYSYFIKIGAFIIQMTELFETIKERNWEVVSLAQLQEENAKNYREVLGDTYISSYTNPTYAVDKMGAQYGKMFSFLAVELRALIIYAYEQDLEAWLIRVELFLEIYQVFFSSFQETKTPPLYAIIEDIVYWFMSDYSEIEVAKRIKALVVSDNQFLVEYIKKIDLNDERFLYRTGEYVTENEIRLMHFINQLSEDTILKMADTYTEGYRQGFIAGNKDLSKKETVEIRYSLGFERVVKFAISNFEKMGLKPTIRRASPSIFGKTGVTKNGFYGAIPNKQLDYDHKEDAGLFLDKVYSNRSLEALQQGFEVVKREASTFAGPAVIEIFGEPPFSPVNKKESVKFSPLQQRIRVSEATKAGEISNIYIKGEERSFTIIAFPIPSIGDNFEEIFDEVIQINTLNSNSYAMIQQTIIDTLDQARAVIIKGENGNKTDLQVHLSPLLDRDKETKFENCTADVNIPVGEVFTSPVLLGTNGMLHVKKVFLNELEYNDLEIGFIDGMVTTYSCQNFKVEEENKQYIKDNILFSRDTLPLGEFAIGTNTTAYVAAKKYKIEDKLPILIAEKMGPHFALGDTCYSHSEDIIVYNPNGKEIIAKDNSVSRLRKTSKKEEAYMNCHTDITIPYDELGELSAVLEDGTKTEIILHGRFVLPGTEELNIPFGDND